MALCHISVQNRNWIEDMPKRSKYWLDLYSAGKDNTQLTTKSRKDLQTKKHTHIYSYERQSVRQLFSQHYLSLSHIQLKQLRHRQAYYQKYNWFLSDLEDDRWKLRRLNFWGNGLTSTESTMISISLTSS